MEGEDRALFILVQYAERRIGQAEAHVELIAYLAADRAAGEFGRHRLGRLRIARISPALREEGRAGEAKCLLVLASQGAGDEHRATTAPEALDACFCAVCPRHRHGYGLRARRIG
jgi:hypothetical protein